MRSWKQGIAGSCKSILAVVFCLTAVGCYRQDPVVRAAEDLREMAYDYAEQEQERIDRLHALRLGMSDEQVIDEAGPPSIRRSAGSSPEDSQEIWTYRRGTHILATLTFTNRRLTEIRAE